MNFALSKENTEERRVNISMVPLSERSEGKGTDGQEEGGIKQWNTNIIAGDAANCTVTETMRIRGTTARSATESATAKIWYIEKSIQKDESINITERMH